MARVYFFTGYRMLVFEFSRGAVTARLDFACDNNGFEQFEFFLSNCTKQKSQLLLDVREEDFIREQVPHVSGADRKELLDRMERRVFRDAEYRFTKPLGRMEDGRKDDLVLFSSLLDNESFNRCMALFYEHATPISGVWSVAFLGERLLAKLKAKEESILLFSRQMRSAVRETLFKKGKLYVSRQAKLDRRIRNEHSAETIATIIASNVEVMQRFLINQRIVMGFEKLHVYSVVEDDHIEKLKQHCANSNTLQFNFIGIQSIFERFGLEFQDGFATDILFSYICSREPDSTQQYLNKEKKRPYYAYVLDKSLTAASLVGSFVFIVIGVFFLLNAIEFSHMRDFEVNKILNLNAEHEDKYSAVEHRISDAQKIKGSVELVEKIRTEAKYSPNSLFPYLGAIFERESFSVFSVDTLVWEKHNPNEIQAIVSAYIDLSKATVPEEEMYDEESEPFAPQFQPSLRVRGRINRDAMSYSEAVSRTELLIRALRDIPLAVDVQILVSPVDVRLGSKFTDSSGVEKKGKSVKKDNVTYDFRLILKSPHNDAMEDLNGSI